MTDMTTPPPQRATLTDVVTSLHAVRTSIDVLSNSMGNLASHDEVDEKVHRTHRSIVWTFGPVTAVLIIAFAFVGVTQIQLREIASQNRANNRVLVECTTPGNPKSKTRSDRVHECYDSGQAGQAHAVSVIVDADQNGVTDTVQIQDQLIAIAKSLGVTLTTPTTAPKP